MTENEAVTPHALGDDADGAVRSSPAHLHQGERVQTEETGAVTLYTRVTESGGRMRWSFRVQPNMAAAGRVFVFSQPGFRLIYRPSNVTSGAQGTPSAIEARDGQQTAASRDDQQTAESRDDQQAIETHDGQQTAASRDNQQTAESRDDQQTAESRDCQQAAESRDCQQAAESRDCQQITQSHDGQQTAESRDCQQTTQSRDNQQDQPQQRHQRRQGGSPADFRKRRRRSYRKRHLGASVSKADNSACKFAKMAEQTAEQTRN